MKISLKKNQVAILKEESGEVVGVFNATPYANEAMMTAVAEHFDVAVVGLNTDRDFDSPLDYEQPYEFVLYKSGGEDECVTLIMTYSFLFTNNQKQNQMKTLTENQQAIIDSLTSEFNRINNASKQTRSFNLIDIAPLDEKTKQIRQFKEEAELDARTWDGLAKGEADRIVRLLQEDLTSLVVERYGSHNGHHDLPTVVIKPKKGIVHHEYCVSIEVVVNKERVHQGHDCYYDKGVSLGYKHGDICPSRTYNTIEDLLEHSLVKEYIRMRLLSVIK